jgi:hypothetical protein
MTMALCPPGGYGDLYVVGLGSVTSYAIANNQLTLTLQGGGTLVYS